MSSDLKTAQNQALSVTMTRMMTLARLVDKSAPPLELDALAKAVHHFVMAIRCSTCINLEEVLSNNPPPKSLNGAETVEAIRLMLNLRAYDYAEEINKTEAQLINLIEAIIKEKAQ